MMVQHTPLRIQAVERSCVRVGLGGCGYRAHICKSARHSRPARPGALHSTHTLQPWCHAQAIHKHGGGGDTACVLLCYALLQGVW